MATNGNRIGKVFEREVVNAFIAAGFPAERTAPMQAGENKGELPDVLVSWINRPKQYHNEYGGEIKRIKVECKREAARLPDYLWQPDPFAKRSPNKFLLDALEGADIVVFHKPVKGGRRLPLMVFREASMNIHRAGFQVLTLAEYMEELKR